MEIPGLADLQAERAAVIETMESLTDDEFEHGPTLCEAWAPRDVLAHLMGIDTQLVQYVKAKGNVSAANQAIVDKARPQSRTRLMNRAHHWAQRPAPLIAGTAYLFLGDLGMHHQDVLRGLGRTRDIPDPIRAAILREGMVLGAKTLMAHKVAPTDGGRSVGRGPVVRGTSEALGLWLAGRKGLEDELEFE
jgi:uncharacterized protein (TIGR03083 family)